MVTQGDRHAVLLHSITGKVKNSEIDNDVGASSLRAPPGPCYIDKQQSAILKAKER